jgi:hypothetical protein
MARYLLNLDELYDKQARSASAGRKKLRSRPGPYWCNLLRLRPKPAHMKAVRLLQLKH